MQFEHPYVVFAAAATIVGIVLLAQRSQSRRRAYAFFGAVAGALCVLSLGRPFTTETGEEARRIEWVVDLTAPMRWPDRPADAQALKNLMGAADSPSSGSVIISDEAGMLRLPVDQLDDWLYGYRPEGRPARGDASRTRMLAAAMEMVDDDCDVAVVSDATLASLAMSQAQARLAERSGSVYLIELPPLERDESGFRVRIECPDRLREGEPVEITGEVLASPEQAFSATLRAGAADSVRKALLTDAQGRARIALPQQTFGPGEHLVQLEAESDDGVVHTAAAVLSVRPRARIVSIGDRSKLDPIGAILQAEGYSLTRADVAANTLDRVDVVLTELAALEALADAPLARLADAVARQGMGLVVLSSATRNATRAPDRTLASLLPVDIIAEPPPPEPEPEPDPTPPPPPPPPPPEKKLPKPEKKPKKVPRPSFAVVAVIDKSGSMHGDKLRLAQLAVMATARTIHDEDTLGVLAFDSVPKWVFKPKRAFRYLALDAALKEMSAGGGTNVYRALEVAYTEIRNLNANIKHVILATDGRTELADFKGLIEKMADDDVTVSTVAIGTEADHNLLARISGWGGGGFYFTSSYREIPQIFTVDARRFMPIEPDEQEPDEPEPKPDEKEEPPGDDPVTQRVVARPDETPPPEPDPPVRKPAKKTYRLLKVEDLQVIAGIPEKGLPVLGGRSLAREKALSAVALADEAGVPVLVVGRVGLGRVVYWGSDAGGDWSPDLLRWPFASKLFSQMVNTASAISGIRQTAIAARVMRRKDDLEVIAVVYPSVAGDDGTFEMSARLVDDDTPCDVRRLERRVFRIRTPPSPPGRQQVLQLDLQSSKGRPASALVVLADPGPTEDDRRDSPPRARDVSTRSLAGDAIEQTRRSVERRRYLSPFVLLAALGFFVLALTEARRSGVIG